jgi:hypothetical protein
MGAIIEVKYFNTFLLKKVFTDSDIPEYGGSFGVPQPLSGSWPTADLSGDENKEWVIEEARIEGGYNNPSVDFGVKAYIVEDDNTASIRSSSLIYSGIFNSRTGVNNTNVFSAAEPITKSVDPANGSIQRLYAEDTNLIIFQEDKVSRALIDKNAIYSAEGDATVTSAPSVIGQVQAYAGNYGISQDPESFAVYGYRKYFTDRSRNAVIRLSQDGITEISQYGMTDWFRDEFANIDNPGIPGSVIGGWDVHNKEYVLSLQSNLPATEQNPTSRPWYTLSFNEDSQGFPSFFSYKPSQIISLKNNFYTLHKGSLWQHYSEDSGTRCNFYGVQYGCNVQFIFNDNPSNVKIFKTANYEGSNGWQIDTFVSDLTGPNYSAQEIDGAFYNYSFDNVGITGNNTDPAVFSYITGAYDDYGHSYPQLLYPPINRAGFDRKENKYMAVLINKSVANQEEIMWGDEMSGIKGYFATVTMSLDGVTDVGGPKELYSVSTGIDYSTY